MSVHLGVLPPPPPHTKKLATLLPISIPSLHHRRMRSDMIDVGLYNTNLDMHVLPGNRRENTWSLPEAIDKTFSRLDVRKVCFAIRVVGLWNSLPEEVVSACSVNTFKNRLDKAWEKVAYMI